MPFLCLVLIFKFKHQSYTPKQYKEFIKTFKDYNDPESKDYLNKGKLREKAQAYKDYKLVNGKTIDDLSGTSSARTQFADDVLETIDEMATSYW